MKIIALTMIATIISCSNHEMMRRDVCEIDELINGLKVDVELIWETDGIGASKFFGTNCLDSYLDVDLDYLDDDEYSGLTSEIISESVRIGGPISIKINAHGLVLLNDGGSRVLQLKHIVSWERLDKIDVVSSNGSITQTIIDLNKH